MTYNPDVHNRQSIRLSGFDYAQPGFYFVTICTKERGYHDFGEIIDGKMQLSEIGEIVRDNWLNTLNVRKNVRLDEFVVMPNHFHGIVEIVYKIDNQKVGIDCNQALHPREKKPFHEFGSQSNNLFAIIRGFKGAVTKQANKIRGVMYGSIWQSRFYDRIIRNRAELQKVRTYIKNNIAKWQLDIENKKFRQAISEQDRKKHYHSLIF